MQIEEQPVQQDPITTAPPIPSSNPPPQQIVEEQKEIMDGDEQKERNKQEEDKKCQQQKEQAVEIKTSEQKQIQELIKLFMWGSCEIDQYDPGEANCIDGSCRSGVHIPISHLLISQKEQIKSVHCGALHTFLLTTYGRVFSLGCNDDGVLGREGAENEPELVKLPVRVDLLSTGDSHCVCGSTRYNRVFQWGVFRSTNGNMTAPQRVYKEIEWSRKNNIVEIVSGSNHCLMRTEKGKLFVCGDPECLVLGRVPGQRRRFQQALGFEGMNLSGVEKVWSGGNHAFVRVVKRRKGVETVKVQAWGSNNYGQLGIGEEEEQVRVPRDIVGLEHGKVRCMGGGEHHSVAVMEDGSVWAWGRNDEGEIGRELNGKEEGEKAKFVREPVRVEGVAKPVEECVIGPTFCFVIGGKGKKKEEQEVYSWGNGDMYILGNGREENERVPYQIKPAFFKKRVLVGIDVGAQHGAFLVKEDEMVKEQEFVNDELIIVENMSEKEEEIKRKKSKDEHNEEEEKEEVEEEKEKKEEKKTKLKKEKKQTTKKKVEKQEKAPRKSQAKSASKEPKKSKSKSPQKKSKKQKIEQEAQLNSKSKKKQGKGKKSPNTNKRLHGEAFQEEKPNQDISNPLQKSKD